MTVIWLVCFVFSGMPSITQWWPPQGWAMSLYLCLFVDIFSSR